MTSFAEHRDTVESFVDYMHSGPDIDGLARLLAHDVVITGPLSAEPLIGHAAVTAAIRDISAAATDLAYREILTGETHHAAFFRLQIDDATVDGMDYIRLNEDGKIAEITIFWRPLPSALEMQARLTTRTGPQTSGRRHEAE